MTSPSHQPRARGERVYRLLLLLYPRRFRQRYRDDMLAFYRERVESSNERSLVAIWAELIPDLLATAIAERFVWLHRDLDPAPRTVTQYSHRREEPMSILKQDLRYALRGMLRRPGFAAIVLATLALGIGANAAIFTVVNAVLLRPLPFAHVDRTVVLAHREPLFSVSEPEFVDYQRGVKAFARLAAFSTPGITVANGDGEPIKSYAARVSRDFFDIVGTKPMLGRVFAPDEFLPTSKARLTVISHQLWVQAFASDPHVVGKAVTISGTPVTIIGVMPSGFTYPESDVSLWTAWRLDPDSLWTRNNHYLSAIGEVAPGATIEQARAQVRTLNARWMKDFPETYSADHPIQAEVIPLRDQLLGPTRPYLLALLGAVGFILLIACVNVANLLLVRNEGRRKELAIRTALGASHGRILRQTITESMVFAICGALLGSLLAWFGTRGLIALAPADLPRVEEIGVDGRVVLFTIAITVATGLIFGSAPSMRGLRGDSAETLREGGKTSAHGGSRIARRALVIAETALAVVMLSGAGLLVRSLIKLQAIDLGFDPSQVLTMQLTLPAKKYTDTTADQFYRQLLERVSHVPTVNSAAAVSYLPISGSDNGWSILVDGKVVKTIAEAPAARPEHVTPEYFRAMGIRLVRGRAFTEQDRMGAAPVAIISDGMAKKLYPGVDPIGRTLKMFSDAAPWVTIVGVAADVRARGFQKEIPPTMYFPYSQSGQSAYGIPRTMTLIVRAPGNVSRLTAPVRKIIREMDSLVPVSQVATMDDVVGNSIASRRFTTALLAGFAALALVLAGIGIYGVISYGVSQRRYEIGVRMAMGASNGSIVRLVMSEGARMTVAGLAIGLLGALVVERSLASLLVGVTSTDAPTLAVVCLLLAAVGACACLIPARRATGVSPTEALRSG